MKYLFGGSSLGVFIYFIYVSITAPIVALGTSGYVQSLDTGLYISQCVMGHMLPADYGYCAEVFSHPVNKHRDNYCSMPALQATAVIMDMPTPPGAGCVIPKSDLQEVHRKLRMANVHVPDFNQWWNAK